MICFCGKASTCKGTPDGLSHAHHIWSNSPTGGNYYTGNLNYSSLTVRGFSPKYAYSVRCVRRLKKCVYLIKQTLNKLCDIYSSTLGSLRCDIRASYCIGSMENSCRSFDVWTGNAYGSTYYYYHLQYGGLTRGVREPIDAFSVRCVL